MAEALLAPYAPKPFADTVGEPLKEDSGALSDDSANTHEFIRSYPSAKAARFEREGWEEGRYAAASALEPEQPGWSPADSAALYNVSGWGAPYFSVNAAGHLAVSPKAENGPTLDLHEIVAQLAAGGLRTPVLFRFLDIVCHRMDALDAAFAAAISRFEYQGRYAGLFPVKCNHDRDLVSTVVGHGGGRGWGLEVGSKAELVMVVPLLAGVPGVNLVCNGYKDAEYMELALHCRELGINAMVVMEQYSELDVLLGAAERLGVRPVVGIRAKLATRHGGHWGSTSGEAAKFGLRAREIVAVVGRLREAGLLDCLQLLHFHAGSQITNIRMVKEVMREGTCLYAELAQMGAAMAFLDVGGGLAIDYDGSCTDSAASMAYSLQHYANDVVSAMQEVCIQRGIAPPVLLSESGRALGSHHSVLVFDVLTAPEASLERRGEEEEVVDSVEIRGDRPLTKQLRAAAAAGQGRFLLMTFKEVFDNIAPDAGVLRECAADAAYFRDEALRAFKLGVLSLTERAAVEVMHDAALARIREVAAAGGLPLPEGLRGPDGGEGGGGVGADARPKLYHVNMSVFRSAVDSWAISQLFPVAPIHRLGERPDVAATLADLTCDSDGKLDRFVNPKGGEPLRSLQLHSVRGGEPYRLGLFLTGVYQEVMGSVHNMFGSVNAVAIRARPGAAPGSTGGDVLSVGPDGRLGAESFVVESVRGGETVGEVLSRANHHAGEMLASVKLATEAAVMGGGMRPEVAERLLDRYAARMGGYTYMV